MKYRIFLSLVSMLFLFATASDSQTSSTVRPPAAITTAAEGDPAILGEMVDNLYINRFLAFRLEVPKSYLILNRAEIKVYENAGKDMIKAGTDKKTPVFDAALARTLSLLVVATKEPGQLNNSVLEIAVVKQGAGVTRDMVLAQSVKAMTETGQYKVLRSVETVRFGGRTFSGVEFETGAFGLPLKTGLYITMQKNFALTIGLTYSSEEGMKEIEKLAGALNFSVN